MFSLFKEPVRVPDVQRVPTDRHNRIRRLHAAVLFYHILILYQYIIYYMATSSNPPSANRNWTEAETDALISWASDQPGIKTQANFNAQQLKAAAAAVSAVPGSPGRAAAQVKTKWSACIQLKTSFKAVTKYCDSSGMSFTEESSANVTTEAEEKVFGDYLAAHSKDKDLAMFKKHGFPFYQRLCDVIEPNLTVQGHFAFHASSSTSSGSAAYPQSASTSSGSAAALPPQSLSVPSALPKDDDVEMIVDDRGSMLPHPPLPFVSLPSVPQSSSGRLSSLPSTTTGVSSTSGSLKRKSDGGGSDGRRAKWSSRKATDEAPSHVMLLNGLQSSVNSAGDVFRTATAMPEGQIQSAAQRVQGYNLSDDDLDLIGEHFKIPYNAAWFLGLRDDSARAYVERELKKLQLPQPSLN
ncbi:hypothetical protein F5887DRAFT_918047 [Amanita rubescens]|nr:hypothetical protein F5887DRAFT_918047 [Amanita rubescens]